MQAVGNSKDSKLVLTPQKLAAPVNSFRKLAWTVLIFFLNTYLWNKEKNFIGSLKSIWLSEYLDIKKKWQCFYIIPIPLIIIPTKSVLKNERFMKGLFLVFMLVGIHTITHEILWNKLLYHEKVEI